MKEKDLKYFLSRIPTWVIVLLFFMATPLGIALAIAKGIAKDAIKDEERQQRIQFTRMHTEAPSAEEMARAEELRRRNQRQREAEEHQQEEEKNGLLSLRKGKLMAGFGFAGVGLFGLTALSELTNFYVADALTYLVMAAGCGGLAYLGRKQMQRARRLRRLVDYVGSSRCVRLDQLADMMDYRQRDLKEDLRKLMDHGFFRGAFIDDENACFRWLDAGGNLGKTRQAPRKKKADGEYPEVLAIRGINERIENEAVSEKLKVLEKRTRAIYDYLNLHPEKRDKARMFENHYFPTTMKILGAYADFENSGVRGENVAAAMREVEQVLDTLIQCFEKQLDCLYADQAMDTTAEVKVMEDLLAREGLAESLTLRM